MVEFTVKDIQGEDIKTWLPLVHQISIAAVAPFAGALSDLIGRRYLGIIGAIIVIAGSIVVGTAHHMPLAIIGMAIAGVGGAITFVIGFAGIVELVPVRARGRYIGTVFLCFCPLAASSAYGSSPLIRNLTVSTNVLCHSDVEMECMDSRYHCGDCRLAHSFAISSTSTTKLSRLHQARNSRAC